MVGVRLGWLQSGLGEGKDRVAFGATDGWMGGRSFANGGWCAHGMGAQHYERIQNLVAAASGRGYVGGKGALTRHWFWSGEVLRAKGIFGRQIPCCASLPPPGKRTGLRSQFMVGTLILMPFPCGGKASGLVTVSHRLERGHHVIMS
uniref:Uncharacterized protein n=1 Tax=Trieres chinensis TaxID=1514140 RepID=A0A7S1Z2F5_TRICV|mmetsp:Transcript_16223/g.33305  ORF Transcript_16223/g.33305 Transcript_16223/m.33305 type:complete len:147 (+) Transcript_16223:333-773(+)